MNIATAKAIVRIPGQNYVIVRFETRDGLVGWGDATLNGRELAVKAAFEHHIFRN